MRTTLVALMLFPAVALAEDPVATPAPATPSGAIPPEYTPAAPPIVASTPEDLWNGRVDPDTLQRALAAYEAQVQANPADREALGKLVRGWYFFGDAFTDDVPTKLERWEKAIGYGNTCLALNTEYKARLDGGEKEKDIAGTGKLEDVPCLYWTSTALGKWAKAQSLSLTLKHLPTVKAYMTQVEALDPTYFNYGPARYWGAYNAALPSFAGKDLVKSEEYFKASIEGAPDYLATRVLRAEMLDVQKQDLKQFEEDLNFVINADPGKLAECKPENTKEQEKAKKLLAKKDELFAGLATDAPAATEGKKKKDKGK